MMMNPKLPFAATVVFVGLALPSLGCSSGPDRPGGLEDVQEAGASDTGSPDGTTKDGATGDDASPGKDAAETGDATSRDATSGDATSEDGAAVVGDAGTGEAGADDSGGPTGPPPPPAGCKTTATWGAGTLLDVSGGSDDVLDSVTPDELSIAWTVVNGGTKTIHYGDRSSTAASFVAQSLPAGLFTNDRVALSYDGLRLLVIDPDGQGFSQLTRAARGDAFNPSADAGVSAASNYGNFAGHLKAGQSYGDPLLAADDGVFYYSVYGGTADAGAPTIFRTARLLVTDAWPAGAPLATSTGLLPQGALRRRPTGLSSDQQTLFFWDEVTGTERAAWISGAGAFDSFVDLGSRSMAAPNAACSALYYSAQGSSSIDLFRATSN
jgi:hypothetical protein